MVFSSRSENTMPEIEAVGLDIEGADVTGILDAAAKAISEMKLDERNV